MSGAAIDSLWDYADPSGSETRFREALEEASGTEQRMELQTQLARALTLQRRYDEASQVMEQVEDRLNDAPIRVRVRCLLERSRWLNDTGDTERALDASRQAFELASTVPALIGFAIDAGHMLGYIGDPLPATTWNARSIGLAEASSEPAARRWIGRLWSNQGHKFLALARYEEALDCFHHAHAERERRGELREARYARCDMARTRRLLGRVSEARAQQAELHEEFLAEGGPDGYVLEELAECDLLLGDARRASANFALAYRILSRDPWFPPSQADRLARIRRLGNLPPSG